MAKVGRNDPCPCGSGKKYKQCHLPIEEAERARQRQLHQAPDTLLPRVLEAAQEHAAAVPGALERFWNGKYRPEQLAELDDLEDRGAERFLSWFAFDYLLDDQRTLVERLAAGGLADLSAPEAEVLGSWPPVRLRPYTVEAVQRGQGFHLRDLLDESLYEVEDRAASRRVDPGDVLIVHVLPAGDRSYIGGAAAHLTADTREKLREFLELHLEDYRREHPGASWGDMLRDRSEVLNHFVMALPVEAPDPSLLEKIILQTRASLQLAGESLGIVRDKGEAGAETPAHEPDRTG